MAQNQKSDKKQDQKQDQKKSTPGKGGAKTDQKKSGK